MYMYTSTYQIPNASLNLRGKKSCDPLFHLVLFYFRRILGRRGSWREKCCECFKMFFYHESRTKWRSTHVYILHSCIVHVCNLCWNYWDKKRIVNSLDSGTLNVVSLLAALVVRVNKNEEAWSSGSEQQQYRTPKSTFRGCRQRSET